MPADIRRLASQWQPRITKAAAFVEAVGKRRVEFGPAALTAMAAEKGQVVMNGIVGVAGLPVTLAAAHAGNRVALANKESMVAAGALVNEALARGGGELIPVDSEHSAIFQCLVGEEAPSRIVLTASGGPFRGKNRAQLERRPLPRLWLIRLEHGETHHRRFGDARQQSARGP